MATKGHDGQDEGQDELRGGPYSSQRYPAPERPLLQEPAEYEEGERMNGLTFWTYNDREKVLDQNLGVSEPLRFLRDLTRTERIRQAIKDSLR